MEEKVYIGINTYWDCVNRTVILSMPNYVRKALHIFQHVLMHGKEYSPHICAPIQYGQIIQYVEPLDAFKYFSDKETNTIQPVCGTLLYYAIAIDNTVIPSLSDISSE